MVYVYYHNSVMYKDFRPALGRQLMYHKPMYLSEFDYELPQELIAQHPLAERDASRMLLLERRSGRYEDHAFGELPDLLHGDELIVVNDARVIAARLFGYRMGVCAEAPAERSPSASKFLASRIEVLLVRRVKDDLWEALVRPGRKVRAGEELTFEGTTLKAEIVGRGDYGLRQLRFRADGDVWQEIERIGHTPLPPYIRREDQPEDRGRYQTMFARTPGAVAAPTAGLHFTPAIVHRLRGRGIDLVEITLEVGLGTFQPIRCENLDLHRMHSEAYEISPSAAASIARAKRDGRPILAVGTTVVRALEDAAQKLLLRGATAATTVSGRENAEIFIRPGHRFALVDQLLTNFHLPRSTLLVLAAAFAGREEILSAYQHAVASGYRFYSYGDCMLIR
jgi:S-adenosylmethionine:tRNA ribosyltransferase-isomerase